MKKELKDIKAEPNTIKAIILKDAGGDINYIKNVAYSGCVSGSCNNLIYCTDTHAFYNEHAEEIDELLEKIAEDMGEPYNITENMKRLNQSDLRNFLAWLAYEVTAQEILKEIDEDY